MSFVWSSWLKSFSEAEQNRKLPRAIYYRAQKALITDLLDSNTCKVLVARSPVDDLVIRGYVVFDGSELHWVYVRSVWRRQGIAGELIRAAGGLETYTHSHEPGGSRLRGMGLTYDGRLFGGRDKR